MDTNDSLVNLYSNDLESLTGFYEETFDDKCSYRSNSTVDLFANTISESSSRNDQPSYITLGVPNYAQEPTDVQQVASLTSEQNLGEIKLKNTVDLTPHNKPDQNSRDANSTLNQIAISLNTDGASTQITSSPLHIIPVRDILKTGTIT